MIESMTDLLTSPWFWCAHYVVAGIAAVVLAARVEGRMTVGVVIVCFLFGFVITSICLLFVLFPALGERFEALMEKEIWRRK